MQSKVIQAATRLHNFIIDGDRPEFGTIRMCPDGTIDPTELERFGVEPLPVAIQHDHGPLQDIGPAGNVGFIGFNGLEFDIDEGTSARRDAIVNALADKNIRRPQRL
jgi:hypothetical protein